MEAKDPRFDGWFFVAVRSTGIYCRPSCPSRTPLRRNVAFHSTAASAQRAGYRACKRCRPDASPGSPEWNVRGDLAGRALRLIADGIVDREGVPGLARRVGYSERQLHRVLVTEVGAGPIALARAQRAQTARILLETTDLPTADVHLPPDSRASGNSTTRCETCSPPPDRARAAPTARSRGLAPRCGPATPAVPEAAGSAVDARLPRRAGDSRRRVGAWRHLSAHAGFAQRRCAGRDSPRRRQLSLVPVGTRPPARSGGRRGPLAALARPRRRSGRR